MAEWGNPGSLGGRCIEERKDGRCKTLDPQGSHLKKTSILEQADLKDKTITRVKIGIGPRPASRDPDDVATFVLGRFRSDEVERIQGLGPAVWQRLQQQI